MREILFRGKRIYDGKWIYGNLVVDKSMEPHIVPHDFFFEDGHHLVYDDDTDNPVFIFKDSVGQYTGLNDKNGKRIFEGDVVVWTRDDIRIIGKYAYDLRTMYTKGAKFQVIASEAGFMLAVPEDNMLDAPSAWEKIDNYAFWNHHRGLEVIGNIHDNPDLLK